MGRDGIGRGEGIIKKETCDKISRDRFVTGDHVPTEREIGIGCLQRIADALESIDRKLDRILQEKQIAS
jgi:hypothetical protein